MRQPTEDSNREHPSAEAADACVRRGKAEGQLGWLSRNVLALSVTSLFTDMHTHTIMALLPTFMSSVLGMSKSLIGLVEGLGTGAAGATQWLSGWVSDRMRRRKPFAVAGYGLSLAVKPLLAIAQSFGHVLFVRLTDRLGKGIRKAPRDALIADSTPAEKRGRAFGFHRAADTVGAIGGALLAYVLLRTLGGDYRMTFLWATVAGFISVGVLIAFVRDVPPGEPRHGSDAVQEAAGPFPRAFRLFLLPHSLFHLGTLSYAFLLLRAGEVGVPDATLGLLYLVYNAAYALGAFPMGGAVDVVGGRRALVAGYLLFACTSIGIVLSGSPGTMWLWFVLYGAHRACVDPAEPAYISALVGGLRRGSALGLVHSLTALTSLPANLIAGLLWDRVGSTWTFAFAAGAATLAAAILALLRRLDRRPPRELPGATDG